VTHAAVAANQAAAVCGDSIAYIGAYAERYFTSAAAAEKAAGCRNAMHQLQPIIELSAECCQQDPAYFGSTASVAARFAQLRVLRGLQLVADVRKAVQEDGLVDKLRASAKSVSGLLPLPHACNNPDCVSLQQRSELQLVAVKGSRCSGCKVAR
jgi:hypothetical protein